MAAPENNSTKITGAQKAAILLVALGDKISGEVMKQLNDDEAKTISKAIARLDKVTPSQTESVLEEFCELTGQGGGRGGFDYAKRILSNALDRRAPNASPTTFRVPARASTRTSRPCRKPIRIS